MDKQADEFKQKGNEHFKSIFLTLEMDIELA